MGKGWDEGEGKERLVVSGVGDVECVRVMEGGRLVSGLGWRWWCVGGWLVG